MRRFLYSCPSLGEQPLFVLFENDNGRPTAMPLIDPIEGERGLQQMLRFNIGFSAVMRQVCLDLERWPRVSVFVAAGVKRTEETMDLAEVA